MDPRKFALYGGIVMLVMGVLSLVAPGSAEGLPTLNLETSYGHFLGLFPMNIINKVALIVFGTAGIAAANAKFTALPMSIYYSRTVAIVMGVLAVLGLSEGTNTLGGYTPLFGGEVFSHAALAAIGAYFGWALTSKVPDSGPARTGYTGPLQSR